jgi:hypothetical protein
VWPSAILESQWLSILDLRHGNSVLLEWTATFRTQRIADDRST